MAEDSVSFVCTAVHLGEAYHLFVHGTNLQSTAHLSFIENTIVPFFTRHGCERDPQQVSAGAQTSLTWKWAVRVFAVSDLARMCERVGDGRTHL